jgi:hypothetical protein
MFAVTSRFGRIAQNYALRVSELPRAGNIGDKDGRGGAGPPSKASQRSPRAALAHVQQNGNDGKAARVRSLIVFNATLTSRPFKLPTIELGGGSARCMIATIQALASQREK